MQGQVQKRLEEKVGRLIKLGSLLSFGLRRLVSEEHASGHCVGEFSRTN